MFKKIIIFSVFILLTSTLVSFFIFRPTKPTKKITPPAEINITFIEGWKMEDIAVYLQKNNIADKNIFLDYQKKINKEKYKFLSDAPKNSSLEGYIFPDTYRILKLEKNATSVIDSIYNKAITNFEKKFTQEMFERTKELNLSVYEIVTLASIIENETGRNAITANQKLNLEKERKVVSGIFYNRLKAGIALQSDATINYVTQKNNPAPSQNDLETKSPYNTYLNKGLPPGPISNPSISSILAALYPEKTDYYYFLHKQPSGEVVYSKTFEEHVKNKFKYLK